METCLSGSTRVSYLVVVLFCKEFSLRNIYLIDIYIFCICSQVICFISWVIDHIKRKTLYNANFANNECTGVLNLFLFSRL